MTHVHSICSPVGLKCMHYVYVCRILIFQRHRTYKLDTGQLYNDIVNRM